VNKRLLSIVCLFGIILLTSCSNPEQEATKLLTEASEIFKSASNLEETSFSLAYDRYKEVLTKIEEIKTKYPESEVVKGLDQGDAKIGFFTLAKLKEYVSSYARIKAQAEGDILSCAIAMVYKIEPSAFLSDQHSTLYHIFNSEFVNVDHCNQALRVVKKLPPASNTSMLLSLIAEKFAELGQFDQASKLIEEISDPVIEVEIFRTMADKYAELGKLKEAVEIAKSIEDQDKRNFTFNSIAVKLAEAGHDEQIFEIIGLMDSGFDRAWTLTEIATVYAEAGKKNKAAKFLTQAIKEGQKIKDQADRNNILMYYITSNEAAGVSHYDEMFEVSKTIENPSARAMILSDLAGRYFELGQKDKAVELLSKTIESANEIKIEDLLSFHIDKEGHLAYVALKFVDFGEHERAYEMVKSMLTKDMIGANTYLNMAKHYVQKGQFGYADEMIKMIDKPRSKVEALITLSGEYYKKKNTPQALETLSQALETVLEIEEPSSRSKNLANIATQYGKMKEIKEAEKILSLAIKEVKEIESGYHKEISLRTIIGNEYASDEHSDQAFEIAKINLHSYHGDSALGMITKKYIDSKDYDKLMEFSYIIDGHDETVETVRSLISLITQCTKDGEKEKALECLAKVLEKVNKDEGFTKKARILAEVAAEYIKIDQKDKALEILYDALINTAPVTITYHDFSVLEDITTNYAQLGGNREAFKIIRAIDGLGKKAAALVFMSNIYSKTGRSLNKEEKEVLHQIIADLGL